MTERVEVHGLSELLSRMTKYPTELVKVGAVTMSASLNTLWENVPAYPAAPVDSTYRRTGTLGKSLGSSQGGGATGGSPSIYRVKQLGQGNFEGQFGTSLDYAPYVIGEGTQAEVHQGRWWTIATIAEKAADKINRLWEMAAKKLAQFLEGKNT